MNRTALLCVLASVVLAGAGGVSAVAQSQAPAAPSVVHIKNFAFTPSPLTIKTGTMVQFINDDPVAHTVTATDGKEFDSGNLDQNAKWSHTFTKAGTYTYLCSLHTYMKGTIVVQDG